MTEVCFLAAGHKEEEEKAARKTNKLFLIHLGII